MAWVEGFCPKGSLEFIPLVDCNKVSREDGACADLALVGGLMFC